MQIQQLHQDSCDALPKGLELWFLCRGRVDLGPEGSELVVAGVSTGSRALSQAHPGWPSDFRSPNYSNLHSILFPHAPRQGVTLEGKRTGLLQLEIAALGGSPLQIDSGAPGASVTPWSCHWEPGASPGQARLTEGPPASWSPSAIIAAVGS